MEKLQTTIYLILEIMYNHLETVLAVTFSGIAVVVYFLCRSISRDIKDMRRTWDKDKYRKF